MKLLCESCQRLGTPASWAVIGGNLRLSCAGCGAMAELTPSPSVTPGPAKAAAVVSFPAHKEAPATPGPFAGHVDRALAEFVSARTPGPLTLAAPDPEATPTAKWAVASEWVEKGWAALQQSWSDPAAHERLIAEATARGSFAELGARYKAHLSRFPDDAVAREARDELVRKATATMMIGMPLEERGITPGQAKLVRNVLLVLFLFGAIAFGGYMLLELR